MSPAECEKTCQKNNLKLIDNSKLYAQWQKSLNVPDVNLGAEFQKLIMETKVEAAYKIWKTQYEQLAEIKPADFNNIKMVYNGMLNNFRKGNISLIEFADFMDSYRETAMQIYDMKDRIIRSAEQLNQLVQTKIFY